METEKIPIPSKRSSKINQIIKQMRWKAFFDMKESDDNTQKNLWLEIVELSPQNQRKDPV